MGGMTRDRRVARRRGRARRGRLREPERSGGKPDEDALYQYEVAINGIIVYLILLAIVYAIGSGLPRREFFALHRPASWPRALALALGGYVAIFVGAGLLLVLLGAGDEQGLTPDDWEPSQAGAYAANFVAVAFVGPIVEELTYRGAGMSLFLPFGPVVAVAVTAIGFGLGHGLLLALPALVFFGARHGRCSACAPRASTPACSCTARSTRPAWSSQ